MRDCLCEEDFFCRAIPEKIFSVCKVCMDYTGLDMDTTISLSYSHMKA